MKEFVFGFEYFLININIIILINLFYLWCFLILKIFKTLILKLFVIKSRLMMRKYL